ncbi:hypothetical protein B0T26DRAFT_675620 [Lasiosphaeria miniovina]|uniref:Uncharacterized protein n=1 Tax=Lasiosphaeria miniovina TaxID=1954250 RepID=A0AA40DVM4_9PEZI|nr:uncharacterized protein B0T26DRAFT_675620 [Lasiosphaeria miniovina]KAK0717290.1 hypothetical protein B0T26DRAFT_675620 [Lasiosphaeria miniovina]
MAWVLHVLAWAAFAIRPLSSSEMEEALEIACSREGQSQARSKPKRALLLTLELALPGLQRVADHVVWAAPELSSYLEGAWADYFGEEDFFRPHSLSGLLAYATKYWIEHQRRVPAPVEGDAAAVEITFSAVLETSPEFDADSFIRYLISQHWSADAAEEAKTKLQPSAIKSALAVYAFDACYISYRMAILPISAQDDLDWILLGIVGATLPEDKYVEITVNSPGLINGIAQPSRLQRAVASAPSHLRKRLLARMEEFGPGFLDENFVEVLLTAISLGNSEAVAELISSAPGSPLGHAGADEPAALGLGLGTALQVACEFGDAEVFEKVLDRQGVGSPRCRSAEAGSILLLECHPRACQHGRDALVGALATRYRNAALNTAASVELSPFRVASARGLHKISSTLAGQEFPADVDGGQGSMSSLQIASTAGFSETLTSLSRQNSCGMSLKPHQNAAIVLAIKSGSNKAASVVHRRLRVAIFDKYVELSRQAHDASNARIVSEGEEDDEAHAEDADDSDDASDAGRGPVSAMLKDVEKIIRDALLAIVGTRRMPLDMFDLVSSNLDDPSEAKDDQSRTLLHLAARMGRLKLVESTAMHYACYHGHHKVVKCFLEKDEVLSRNLAVQNKELATLVTVAAMGGHFKILEQLLPRLSIEELKAEFSRAAKRSLVSLTDSVLKAAVKIDPSSRQDFVQAKDDQSLPPLHLAASNDQPRMIQFLLLHHHNHNINDKGPDTATTPLGRAAQISAVESMRLLLDAGASTDVSVRRGRSILSEAVFWERPAVVKLLLEYGASTRLTGSWSHYGSLFRFGVLNSSLEVVQDIPTPEEALRITIDAINAKNFILAFKSLKRNYPNKVGEVMQECRNSLGSMVESTAQYGTLEVLEALYGIARDYVDFNDTGGPYGTALQAAALDERPVGAEKVCKLLAGLDPEKPGSTAGGDVPNSTKGPTCGKLEFIKALLKDVETRKQLIDMPDVDGWTPLHWGCRSRNFDLVTYLLEAGAQADIPAAVPDKWLPYHVAVENDWGEDVPHRIKAAYKDSKSPPVDESSVKDGSPTCEDFDLCDKCWRHADVLHFPDNVFS